MILVTGASGFVGREIVAEAARRGLRVRGIARCLAAPVTNAEFVIGPDLAVTSDWGPFLNEVDTVVHAAARVHVMHDTEGDPLAEYQRVNVTGTMNLARQAAVAGVKRFVFISSIKVNGESTRPGAPYRADSPPRPVDPYGISKREAEEQLMELARETGMELVVVRPVLVYGPGVRANFRLMMRWLSSGIPLPFASIDNRRSLVALGNLVDLILTCTSHTAAANQIFLVSDGEDVSTPELLRGIASHMGRKALLVPVPPAVLRGTLKIIGMGAEGQRLCGSLQVDITKTRELVSWAPPISFDDAIARTVEYFQRTGG